MRETFTRMAGEDGCVGPDQIRELLYLLRGGAAFVTNDHVNDALTDLSQLNTITRIPYLPFERWFEDYFEKQDALDDSMDV